MNVAGYKGEKGKKKRKMNLENEEMREPKCFPKRIWRVVNFWLLIIGLTALSWISSQ